MQYISKLLFNGILCHCIRGILIIIIHGKLNHFLNLSIVLKCRANKAAEYFVLLLSLLIMSNIIILVKKYKTKMVLKFL